MRSAVPDTAFARLTQHLRSQFTAFFFYFFFSFSFFYQNTEAQHSKSLCAESETGADGGRLRWYPPD